MTATPSPVQSERLQSIAVAGGPQPLIGQQLIARGVISEDQLRIALREQANLNHPVGRLLVMLGFISEATLRDALGASMGKRSIDLVNAVASPEAIRLVPQELARRHRLLPLDYDAAARRLTLAIADPGDIIALDRLQSLVPGGLALETLIAGDAEILEAIDRHYSHEWSIDVLIDEIETGRQAAGEISGGMSRQGEYAQPAVRLIDALLSDAVRRDASDIHFEPEAGFLRIRYRIDGMLRQIRALHKSCWAALAVRIKVMAGMNIAETRAPQDGRISLNIGGRAVDFRVAVQPTIHGENIVLRILDRQKGIVPLDDLGLAAHHRVALRRMIARPEGLILVTGPTGSGKTTTLYSLLNHISDERINIMTLEDPVEYPRMLLRQTSLAEAVKLDFASGIRSILRQDPDVILVGEIRDAETAEMAFHAAMTGHQVYSTLHTNSAIGAIPRLQDLGIPPDILAGNIVGVIAQRLLRRLCPHCRKPVLAEATGEESLGARYRATGCAACDFQGYRGRIAIMEMLRIDDDIDALIARRASAREIRDAALERGYMPLVEDGLRCLREGMTTLEELARVVDLGAHTGFA